MDKTAHSETQRVDVTSAIAEFLKLEDEGLTEKGLIQLLRVCQEDGPAFLQEVSTRLQLLAGVRQFPGAQPDDSGLGHAERVALNLDDVLRQTRTHYAQLSDALGPVRCMGSLEPAEWAALDRLRHLKRQATLLEQIRHGPGQQQISDRIPAVHIVRFAPSTVRELQLDPMRLRLLKPSEFEEFVANRLDRMGFDPTIVGATNHKDGGVDIIAVPKIRTVAAQLIAVQVKHHRGAKKTGRAAVDRLLAWKGTYFGIGLLVTNTYFSGDANWLAKQVRNRSFLRLRDFEDIKRWLQENFTADIDWRELPRQIILAPGVVVELPAVPPE